MIELGFYGSLLISVASDVKRKVSEFVSEENKMKDECMSRVDRLMHVILLDYYIMFNCTEEDKRPFLSIWLVWHLAWTLCGH